MSTLFISHSSRDNAAAEELRARLESQGHHSVFLDLDPEKGIQAGASWERTLYTKLRACRAVVALCSDHYLASQWCFAEIALARMEGKELFALQIDPWSEDSQLPSILTEKQYIDLRTNKDAGYQRLRNGFEVKGIVPEEQRAWAPGEPPYPGLRAFEEKDAPIFFGREAEVQEGVELLNRVRRQGHPRMVMVLGSSGSGKSSLARAGILPRLRRDSDQWRVVGPFRPGRRPVRKLAFAFAESFERAGQPLSWEQIYRRLEPTAEPAKPAEAEAAAETGAEEGRSAQEARQRVLEALAAFERELQAGDERVEASVRQLRENLDSSAEAAAGPSADAGDAADASDEAREAPLAELASRLRGTSEASAVLVVDQFEELLGHEGKGPDHPANRFLQLLRHGVEADDPCLVLATMRSDYLGVLQRSRPLQGVGFKSLSVGPMSRDGMRQVIERPATLGQIQIEGLTERLLDDTGTSDALPLLAFTLRTMWDRYHETRLLDGRGYDELGGLHGAIAQVADDTLEAALALGDKDREGNERDLRDAFLSLARPTEEGSGWARQPASWDRLPGGVRPMLQHFVDHRLLLLRGDGTVEVAHEALFRSWETLRGWLSANSEALHLLREIQVEGAKWRKAEAEDRQEYRWRGGRLARALELRQSGALALGDVESGFIDDSHRAERAAIEAEAARQRRELRRARIFAVVVGAGLVVAVLLALFAYRQKIAAQDQALVAAAAGWLDRDPTRAALILLELRQPEGAPRAVPLMSEAMTRRLARVELSGHQGPVAAAVFGLRDGEPAILTGSRDGTVRVWSATGEGDPILLKAPDEVLSAASPPAGDRFAAALINGTSLLWTPEILAAGGQPVVLEQGGEIHTVAFSDDGERIVTASDNSTVRVWTAEGLPVRTAGGQELTLSLGGDQANSAVFEPDSHRVMVLTNGSEVLLWPAESNDPGAVERFSVAEVRKDGRPTGVGHTTDLVHRASFGPTGRRIVTASSDHSARLWKADGSPILGDDGEQVALGHDGPVYDAQFDGAGERILTASDDGTVRFWKADGSPVTESDGRPVVLRHANGVTSVRLSPDGRSILTACKDGTARLWSVDFHGEPLLLPNQGDQRWVNSTAFSPDGPRGVERIVTVSDDGVARLWDAESGLPAAAPAGREPTIWGSGSTLWPLALIGSHDPLYPLRTFVSPSGDRFLTASEDGTARLRYADGSAVKDARGEEIVQEHEGKINRAAFSPDGKLVVTASDDGTARVWQAKTGERVIELGHGDQPVNSAAFSPDDRRVVTASKDKTARIWNVDGTPVEGAVGAARYLKLEHPAEVYDVAFSPDGRRIATAWGLRAWVWPAAGGEPLIRFEGHEDKVRKVAFDPTGRWVVTGSEDRTARIWNADVEADPVVLRGHTDSVDQVAFSPDGGRLVTTSWDPDARVWKTTYDGLGAAILEATAGVCLPPAFRRKSLGETEDTAQERFERCRRCRGETSFEGFRACILPLVQ